MTFKPITVKEATERLANRLINSAHLTDKENKSTEFYLCDREDALHRISEFDLMCSKVRCEDGYFDYFDYIILDEGLIDRLYVKEN